MRSTRAPAKRSTVNPFVPWVPRASPRQLQAMAGRVLAGDVFQTGSVEECCALLQVLRGSGQGLKPRTDWEKQHAPWTFVVQPIGHVRPA